MDISVENFVWILGIKEFNGNTTWFCLQIQKGGGVVINFSYTKTM